LLIHLSICSSFYLPGRAASELLRFALAKAQADTSITEVYLHVQTSNDEAKQFYMSSGFEDMGIIKDYYKRIDPPDCFILKKTLVR
jgi:ribosomal protein S18 acetylase RimI-like enzyme